MSGYFKSLLATDRLISVFCAGRLVHPVTIQMFGLAGGFDGFWLDQEHAGVSVEQITVAALAGRASGLGSFVRMPLTGYAAVTQSLESGVDGVMAAQVAGAAEAEQFVRWAKFAPRGVRGVNTQGADGHFTRKASADLAHDANRDHFVAIQIETLGALEQADEIAQIDGIDLLFIGPQDLAGSLGVLGQLNHPRVWEAIERVADACRRRRMAWGIVPFDPACATRVAELGCRMLSFTSDVQALRLGIETVQARFGAQFRAE
jgi:2-dehydro-3-deoxyglucarate aldolase/4-hydroxy-2-oxoheptanedioate aldolase